MRSDGSPSWKRWLTWIAGAFCLAVVVSACGGGGDEAGEDGRTEMKLLLPSPPTIYYIGLEVARGLGYFEEEGIELETVATDGSTFVVQQLIAGNQRYGMADAAQVLIAASKGSDLVSVGTIEKNVFTIVSPADSGVDSIEDLEGKALGITEPGGGESALVNAVLRDAGFEAGDEIEILPVGEGGPTAFNALETGRIAAYAGGWNDIAALEVAGFSPRVLTPERYTFLPSGVFVVRRETLEDSDSREILTKMMRAYYKGEIFADENPEAAVQIACELVPEDCEDPDVARKLVERVVEFNRPTEGFARGQHDLTRWQVMVDTFLEGALDQPVEVADVALDELVADATNFDEEAIRAQARDYEPSES